MLSISLSVYDTLFNLNRWSKKKIDSNNIENNIIVKIIEEQCTL